MNFEVRIKDKNIYPYDFSVTDYFDGDDLTDCFDDDDYESAEDFVKLFNALNQDGEKHAYIYEYYK